MGLQPFILFFLLWGPSIYVRYWGIKMVPTLKGLILGESRRRWTSIKTTLHECVAFAAPSLCRVQQSKCQDSSIHEKND